MYNINFLACGLGNYEKILIPYLFFVLLHNTNCFVEIIVLDKDKFITKYKTEIDYIIKKYNFKSFLIRNLKFKLSNHQYNSYRFFEVPEIKAEYTYM